MLELNLDSERPIVFVADIHIKPRWSNALPKVTEDSYVGLQEYLRIVKERKACAIILGGDIFDVNYVKHVWLQKMFFQWVDEVIAEDCQVLAYPGNHDYVLSQEDQEHPVHIHSIHPKIIDIDREEFMHGTRHYACIGHRPLPQDLYDEAEKLPEAVNTLLLHQLVTECGGTTNLNLLPKHCQQILIGDVHEFAGGDTTNGAWWGYPGAMYPQKVHENEHGVFVVSDVPNMVPERDLIYARKAKTFEIAEELSIDSVLAQAKMWVDEVLAYFAGIVDVNPVLAQIQRPVVKLRISRYLIKETRKKAHDLLEDAHMYIEPVAIATKIDMNLSDATAQIPTPVQLLPTYMESLKQSPQVMASYCPYPDESAEIVRELLLAGGAGRKAGDDERRTDGGLLAHGAIIAAALSQVDKEFEDAR